MKKAGLLLASTAAISLSGCASIVSKSQYNVAVSSMPEGAAFVIKDKSGVKVHRGVTPQTVTLSSGAGYFRGATYTVDFTKEGHRPAAETLDSSLNGWYWGNIVFGGLIGMLVVDPATGAMWKLNERVAKVLDPLPPSASPPEIPLAPAPAASATTVEAPLAGI